ncbi:5-amino-6-(5-phosphoribosylamino)uracil reductase [Leifsonia xyli]|uniref:dihydrofolate reductase family protein n=1 Tax=Leifsonia xyli TaxID=1575 RepID=UPI0007CDCEA8|nr:5-amino-6-(5-phosphoribosylamino)uracil reductase [Leifsonia xyli]
MGIVTADIAISLDGFAAGPNQSLEHPLGEGAEERLHAWMFDERSANHREEIEAIVRAGAYIMGRKMFGPVRNEWPAEGERFGDWRGWWGEEPPYHAPVFVLTHYAREQLEMTGTTFYFVTDGIHSAMEQAREVAGDADVSVAGGAETLNQALWAGVVDELRLHVVPLTLGAGERVFDRVPPLDLELVRERVTPEVAHLTYRVRR